jgi:nicotinate (nicotinamide) nucleotide adenylyltransferase
VRPRRVGVFGGTFDPVHVGHLAAAEAAREAASLDEVWFVPAGVPPHKPEGPVASAGDRLTMVRLAVSDHPAFRACAVEVERPGPSYTVDTLRALAAAHPDHRWHCILGSDSLLDLDGWKEPEALVRLAAFVALVRPGWGRQAVEAWLAARPPERRPEVLVVEMPGLDVSSRDLRRRFSEGASCRYLVPEAVRRYVLERGLYGTPRTDGVPGPSTVDVAAVRAAVVARLGPERAAHSLRVAETAARLAARHGLDPHEAYLAGLLHDWCREEPEEALLREAERLGLPLPEPAQRVTAVLHGPVAARVLPERWPGLSRTVLDAIDRHTTGDPAMTAFDCLIYVADLVEPEHRFPGVEALRAAAEEDLWQACLDGLTLTLRHLLETGRRVDPRAVAARNALLVRLGRRPSDQAPGA